jgi:hypothetical protein
MSDKDKAMLASYGRSFVGAVTTAFLIMGGDILALDMDSLRVLVAAGIGATLPTAIRAINPKDPSFGKIADGVTEAVVGKLTKTVPVKKPVAKKKTK